MQLCIVLVKVNYYLTLREISIWYFISIMLFIFLFDFSFVFIKSAEQIAAELDKIKEKLEQYQEDVEELRKVDEQNTWDGDNDSPNEPVSAEESEHWAEQCSNTLKELTVAIFEYFN